MEAQKRRQVEYHEREHYSAHQPRIIDNSHPYVEWLNNYRHRTAFQMMGVSLSGKSVLSVCGGDGQEADFFRSHGATVTVIDLSEVALRAALVRSADLHPACMDAESLAFADRSFDWVIVRDGLHHLARPVKGLYELERVSREGFVIIEAQDSLPVRFLSKLDIAENWDPAGGYVYRFSRREFHKTFCSMQTVKDWKIHTTWLPFGSDVVAHFPAFRRFVYPFIKQPTLCRVLATKPAKIAFKTLFGLMTSVAGYWGNSLIMVAHKN